MSAVDDLAFFQRVAQAGSLTGAARELGLSLSAVSKRLQQLEARLGVSLAARTTRRRKRGRRCRAAGRGGGAPSLRRGSRTRAAAAGPARRRR